MKNQNNQKVEKKSKNYSWIVNLIGWIIIIVFLYLAWQNIKPILNKANNVLGNISTTTNTIKKGANMGNELIDKVNHPIKNIDKFNPF